MRKAIAITIAVLILASATLAFAQDKLVTTRISKVTVAKDKNGNEYVRLSVDTPKELNGVAYTANTAAMAFGAEQVAKARMLKAGATVKMIVSEREFQGRQSYTILKIVE